MTNMHINKSITNSTNASQIMEKARNKKPETDDTVRERRKLEKRNRITNFLWNNRNYFAGGHSLVSV